MAVERYIDNPVASNDQLRLVFFNKDNRVYVAFEVDPLG